MKKARRKARSPFFHFGSRRVRHVAGVKASRPQTRRLNSERLEERVLMAADLAADAPPQFDSPLAAYEFMYQQRAFSDANPNHNWQHAPDVDGNSRVEIFDLLKVIDPLREGTRPLASDAEGEGAGGGAGLGFVDVNGDRFLSIADALGVVQALRAEGEPGDVVAIMPDIDTAGPVTVGQTYNVVVTIQDVRAMDPNPDNSVDDRGVFTGLTDLMFDPNLSGVPLRPLLANDPAAPFFDPLYQTLPLIQQVADGKVRITATQRLAPLDPLGPDQLTFATIPFKVGAVADFATGNEDTTITIDVLGNDTSASGTQTIMTTFVDVPGQVVLVAVQTPGVNENRNGQGVAEEDIMFASDTVTVNVPGAPTLSTVSDPANGSAVISNGQIQYTPDPDFFGTETFTYTISYPGGVTDTATVTVTVTNVPDNPVAVDDPFSATANAVLNQPAPGVLANDTDPDIRQEVPQSQRDRIMITASDAMSVRGAPVTVNADGSFTYDPRGVQAFADLGVGETLVDTFTYTIADRAGATDVGTVSITVTGVNDPPDAVNDPVTLEQANGVFQNIDVLANDIDPDGDTLTITAVTQGNMGGTIQIAGDNRSVNYRHVDGFVGDETFTYTISDGNGGADTATVTVTVTAQALRAVDDTAEAQERGPAIDILVAVNDETETEDQPGMTDEDFNTRVIAINGQAGNGPFTLASGAMVELIPGATFDQTIIRYTPPQAVPGFVGLDTFTYTIDDDTSEDPNDPDPNQPSTATVRVTVVNVFQDGVVANDDPIAQQVTGNQVFNQAAPGVLTNDTDPDLQTITAVAETKMTAQGATVTINADGSFSYDPRNSAAIGALGAGQTLQDTFTYTARDDGQPQATDTATVTLTVVGVNDVPVAANGTITTNEDTIATALSNGNNNLGSLVTDPDMGEVLTFTTANTTTANGATVTINANGTFSYNPTGSTQIQALQMGEQITDTFQYTVTDQSGQSATGTVTVTVTGVNDPPNAMNDTFTLDQNRGQFQPLTGARDPLGNDTDADGDALTITGLGPNNLTTITLATGSVVRINNGVIEYQNNGSDQAESFTYTVSDGNGGTDTATITLNIVAFVPSTISGFVYVDRNNNGARDPGEIGLANVTVRLAGNNSDGVPVNAPPTTTDASGFYEFTNLPPNGPGGYVVSIDDVPFMVDGLESSSTADDVSVSGGPIQPGYTSTAGDNQITINLPSLGDVQSRGNNFSVTGLSPENVSLANIIAYGNQFPSAGLAAVRSGGMGFLSTPTGVGWEQFSMPTFTLNADGTVTIRVRRLSDNVQLSARVPLNTPLSGGSQVTVIGTDALGNTLLKFNGSPQNFPFTPVANGEGEGEDYADAVDAVFAEGV